jgi:PAS domain-containing protein
MAQPDFLSSLPAAVTVCDREGVILYMNAAAERLLAKRGGRALLGSNLYDCHSPDSQDKIRSLMRDRASNTYTVEKAEKKRLIHQSPWFRDGEFAGLVELSFDVPSPLPNVKRD